MSRVVDPVHELRALSPDALAQAGDDSLRQRLTEQAVLAHLKYRPLVPERLSQLLADPDCVRYPTRLVFEFGEMAIHQFAQPDLDHRNAENNGRVLYLRPLLRERPDLTLLAVVYMLPVINYGDVIHDEHCVLYGATLLGLTEEEFYRKICALADFVGTETRCLGTT